MAPYSHTLLGLCQHTPMVLWDFDPPVRVSRFHDKARFPLQANARQTPFLFGTY